MNTHFQNNSLVSRRRTKELQANKVIGHDYCLIISCGVLVAISLARALLILVPFSNLSSLWIHPAHPLSDFNFDAVGDWGCNSNTQSTVNNIKGKNPERIIALGDYSYQPTATCWINAINSIKSVTRINIGNHENDASEGYELYMFE